MKLNVKQPILDYEGNPLMVNKTNPDGSPVYDENKKMIQVAETLRSYLVTALNNIVQGENETFTVEQKAKVYALTTKIYKSKEVNLTVDDLAFIKDRVGKVYGALVYGRICDILEGNEPDLPNLEDDEDDTPTAPKKEKVAISGAKENAAEPSKVS